MAAVKQNIKKEKKKNKLKKQHYGDLLAKMPIFAAPLSFGAPLPTFLLDFCVEVNHEETIESWGYLAVKTA